MRSFSVLLLSLATFFSSNASAQYDVYPKWFLAARAGDPVEVKTISLSTGVKLEYKEQGPANGIPVLLIHGFTDSFEQVMKHLPSSFHVFAITQRGHGNSDNPAKGYFPANFAEDIAAFIKAMNLSKVFMIGHSMGATLTQQFAIEPALGGAEPLCR